MELLGDARVVLLGEASHGTHEFYRERARNTQRLIRDRGFTVVAAGADWPGAYRVNRWIRGTPDLLLPPRDLERLSSALGEPRLERAISVTYRPETERLSHYFEALLPEQF
jgi:erythromycin esterase-like protein